MSGSPPPQVPAEIGLLALLDAPPAFIRRHFVPLFLVAFATRLVSVLPVTVSQAILVSTSWGSGPLAPLEPMFWVLTYGSAFVAGAAVSWALLAQTRAVSLAWRGEPVRIADSLTWALAPRRLGASWAGAAAVAIGLTCCMVLPGLAAAVYLGLVGPVMAFEGERGLGALRRSVDLVRGGRWINDTVVQLLALLFVWFLVALALNAISGIPGALAGAGNAYQQGASGASPEQTSLFLPVWAQIPLAAFGAAVSALSDLYVVVGGVILFHAARERTEGADLARQLSARVPAPAEAP